MNTCGKLFSAKIYKKNTLPILKQHNNLKPKIHCGCQPAATQPLINFLNKIRGDV